MSAVCKVKVVVEAAGALVGESAIVGADGGGGGGEVVTSVSVPTTVDG